MGNRQSVRSPDLRQRRRAVETGQVRGHRRQCCLQEARIAEVVLAAHREEFLRRLGRVGVDRGVAAAVDLGREGVERGLEIARPFALRSEEHTSELQSLMRISYAVFCLKKKKKLKMTQEHHTLRAHS